jgi:hypothetical protein
MFILARDQFEIIATHRSAVSAMLFAETNRILMAATRLFHPMRGRKRVQRGSTLLAISGHNRFPGQYFRKVALPLVAGLAAAKLLAPRRESKL